MKKCVGLFTLIIFILLTSIAYAQNTDKDLIFHFSFDEGKGDTTKNVSQNKLEGTIINADWVDGVVGQALQFNNGALSVPAFGVDEPEEMTIEFWFKPTERITYGKRIDMIYRLKGAGRPHFTFNHSGVFFGCYLGTQGSEFVVQSSYAAFYPQWYYLVLTQDRNKAVLYIDGEIDNEVSKGGPPRIDLVKNGLSLGGHANLKRSFNGSIDEVKMWRVALTAEEIKNTWNKHSLNKQLLTSAHPNGVVKQKLSTEVDPQQEEKNVEVCKHNLQEIGKAIQAYHKEHGDYPEWLSDLHPKHLADANVLICPADKKDGEAIHPYTKDPKNAISYDYQLAPKFRKSIMETQILFGDATPLVRCLHHNEKTITNTLNLSFENKVYQAPYSWQNYPVKIYGSVDAAIDALEAGLEKVPDNNRYFGNYLSLVKLYMKAERKEDAEVIINRFKTVMRPNNHWDGFYLADMLKAMNRGDDMLELYDKLEKEHPKNRFVLEKIADLHKERGNTELELEYRKKYVPGLAFLGEMVPDFAATDLEGEPISIEAYRGKVVLVDFWAVWCGPCVAEMPNVKKVYEKYKDKGFDIIGISLDSDETSLRNYLNENEIPWRQVFSGKGWQSPVAQQYGIYSIPNMWLIDKEGKLLSNKARGEKLESMVAKALKEGPAE